MSIPERGIRDLVVPGSVIAIIAMMVFPLPLSVLDLLLLCNITLSLVLLLSALSLAEPERFTALPTMLLLATLFRLGLNIATTRQLLGQGRAPEVVTAFGEFVVGGNLVVGSVIFLIITLVQFLVIAKGAERVAEVAARFTLDAMPGKQMAIDADVRAGMLSLSEARERRRDLQRESRLYGALDGAMKFVKGDAVAGLVITALNIAGGLMVGVLQQGLPLTVAAHRYTLFTIGDGLVSQIPALLTAVAAGIAVTRVSDRETVSLGRELFGQLGRDPQTCSTAALALLLLACTPGLPALPLCALGGGLLAAAGARRRQQRVDERQSAETQFRPAAQAVCSLRMGRDAAHTLHAEGELLRGVRSLKEEFYRRWGVILTEVDAIISDDLPAAMVEILLRGVAVEHLSVGSEAMATESAAADEAGRAIRSASGLVLSGLERLYERHRGELVDDLQTRMLFEIHEPVAEALINTVTAKNVSVTAISRILRELLREGIAIHALPVILQALAEALSDGTPEVCVPLPSEVLPSCSSHGPGLTGGSNVGEGRVREGALVGSWYAAVRIALRRQILAGLASPSGAVDAVQLDPELDRVIAHSVIHNVALHPELLRRLTEQLAEIFGGESARSTIATAAAGLPGEISRTPSRLLSDGISVRAVVCGALTRPILARLVRSRELPGAVLSLSEVFDAPQLTHRGVLSIPMAEPCEDDDRKRSSDEAARSAGGGRR